MANTKFGLQGNVEKGTTTPDAQGIIWLDDATTPATPKLQYNAAGGTPAFITLGGSGSGSNHDLLDGSVVQDSTAGTVVRGDIITGQGATPTWARLAKGSSGDVLTMGANEPAWSAPTSPAHNLLSATHSDTTTASPTRGDIITAQDSSPTWKRLAKGGRGQVLTMGASEPAWVSRISNIGNVTVLGVYVFSHATTITTSVTTTIVGSTAITAPTVSGGSSTASQFDWSGAYVACYSATTGTLGVTKSGNAHQGRQYSYFRARACVVDNNDGCAWIGFTNLNLTSAADPGGSSHVAMFRARNGTDTNWAACLRDGTTLNAIDTGVLIDANWHTFEVRCSDGATTWKFYIDGTEVASSSTNAPATDTAMGFGCALLSVSSSAREFLIRSIAVAVGDPAHSGDGCASADDESGWLGS